MNIKRTSIIIISLCFSISYAQKDKTCRCPKNEFVREKYGTIFQLSNGLRFLVCGNVDNDTEPAIYNDFIIAECGKKTPIDFWNANKTCEIKLENDTLYVKQMQEFPIGKNFNLQKLVWGTEKIYYSADQLMRKMFINKKLKKYTPLQIDAVNKLYEQTKPGEVNNKKMELAEKLFIATISGDTKSRKYLTDFKIKYKIEEDSEYIDQYNDIIAKLDLWDGKTN